VGLLERVVQYGTGTEAQLLLCSCGAVEQWGSGAVGQWGSGTVGREAAVGPAGLSDFLIYSEDV
jgi:hypothetical protein